MDRVEQVGWGPGRRTGHTAASVDTAALSTVLGWELSCRRASGAGFPGWGRGGDSQMLLRREHLQSAALALMSGESLAGQGQGGAENRRLWCFSRKQVQERGAPEAKMMN